MSLLFCQEKSSLFHIIIFDYVDTARCDVYVYVTEAAYAQVCKHATAVSGRKNAVNCILAASDAPRPNMAESYTNKVKPTSIIHP